MAAELCKISQPPQFLQLLKPDGTLYPHLGQDKWWGSLPEIVILYKNMFRGRQFALAAQPLKNKGFIGTFPSSEGQEALDAALISAMLPEDLLLFSYRKDSFLLERGVPPEQIFQYWGGDERGSVFTKGTGAYPFSIPIGTHTTHAAGIAYSMKLHKEKGVVVCIVGDGGASKGDFYGAMNYAMLFSLPIVFIIENNQWAISTPREKQSAAQTLAQKGIAAGIPEDRCIVVDGNDIFALRQILFNAIEHAREGSGPSVIEGITFRIADHTTVDHAAKYRDPKLVEEARKLDPILRIQRFLERHGAWDAKREEEFADETSQWLKDAIVRYKAIEPYPVEDCFTHLYAALPPHLAEQMADAEKWHAIILEEERVTSERQLTDLQAANEKGEAINEADQEEGQSEGSAISLPAETKARTMSGHTMLEGINMALHYEMKEDPRLIILGEDIGHGGVFRATMGLREQYGRNRVIDAPLDETSLGGVLIGYATQGNKAIGEAQFSGFMHPMVDQLVNHASRLRNRTRGKITCPIVIRAPCYGGIGSPEHHSESIDWLAH
ncbi:thiamine pyrophosphate-dependent enzyme, partial [bacterium]|nr:thiamine pyrophosphate-dependent enzyme [bacterium]